MKVRFWGVRGSIPTPGEATVEFGGNTSCVEVAADSGESVIFDAGTGLRVFGLDYLARKDAPKTINLVISHAHWDHIQGFPFFVPIFIPGFKIKIFCEEVVKTSIRNQMKAPVFPVDFDSLPSSIEFHTIREGVDFEVAGCNISPFMLVHPQNVLGFRLESGGKSVVYSTDTEHSFEEKEEKIIEAIKGSDYLLYDAQYTPEEYAAKVGWGHSTYLAGIDLAKKAGVKTLVLFHHEPTHNDEAVKRILAAAQKEFPDTLAAREGLVLDV